MKIEVSNGEIVDKLTILELKRQNAQTQEQARHIEEELNYLQPIVEGMDIPKELLTQLREVNKNCLHLYVGMEVKLSLSVGKFCIPLVSGIEKNLPHLSKVFP